MPEFTNDLTHADLALLLLLAEKRSLTRSAMTLAWSTRPKRRTGSITPEP